jgi:hypothetical protein
MLGRALDAGVPARWVTADETYGQDHKFRVFLSSGAWVMWSRCPAVSRPKDRLWPHRVPGRCPRRCRLAGGVEETVGR